MTVQWHLGSKMNQAKEPSTKCVVKTKKTFTGLNESGQTVNSKTNLSTTTTARGIHVTDTSSRSHILSEHVCVHLEIVMTDDTLR